MNDILLQIIREIKEELKTYEGMISYTDLETFIGCIIARLKYREIITEVEERILRKHLG